MIEMNEEIKRKVEFHKLYLKDPEKYKEYRADFSGMDLSKEEFVDEDLRGANFSECFIKGCTFICCNLYGCNFHNIYSNFDAEIYLLSHRGVYNFPVYIKMFFLSGNKFDNVHFSFKFKNVEKYYNSLCPESGSFIGYKKAMMFVERGSQLFNMLSEYYSIKTVSVSVPVIVVLKIPEDAKRINPYLSNKCRCDKAEVVGIRIIDHDDLSVYIDHEVVVSRYSDNRLIYEVGEMVYADSFDDNKAIECSHGIHFFMTEKEAIDY